MTATVPVQQGRDVEAGGGHRRIPTVDRTGAPAYHRLPEVG